MFDVDCPRTPDGDDDGGIKKNTNGKIVPSQNSRPPLPPARSRSASVGTGSAAARVSVTTTTTPRTTHRNSQFSPRPRGGGKRTHVKGLEPEEYIATPTMPLPTRQSPVASTFVVPTPTLASSTERRQNSVSTGSQHHVSPAASSTNPFDVDDGEGW
jgi:hypothetical protein